MWPKLLVQESGDLSSSLLAANTCSRSRTPLRPTAGRAWKLGSLRIEKASVSGLLNLSDLLLLLSILLGSQLSIVKAGEEFTSKESAVSCQPQLDSSRGTGPQPKTRLPGQGRFSAPPWPLVTAERGPANCNVGTSSPVSRPW